MAPRPYPIVRTLSPDECAARVPRLGWMHSLVGVVYREDGAERVVCGDPWCCGGCGLPALVVPRDGDLREQRALANCVAMGLLMQDFRAAWNGARVEVPAELRADFLGRWWL